MQDIVVVTNFLTSVKAGECGGGGGGGGGVPSNDRLTLLLDIETQ